jgi:hypothetical protein
MRLLNAATDREYARIAYDLGASKALWKLYPEISDECQTKYNPVDFTRLPGDVVFVAVYSYRPQK